MIQITFNVHGPNEAPPAEHLTDDLSQIFAGEVRVVDVIVLPDDEGDRAEPKRPRSAFASTIKTRTETPERYQS